MAMDWVPGHLYNVAIAVPATSQIDIPLIDPDAWVDSSEVVGEIETASTYYMVRVIGQLFYSMATPEADQVITRLWMGQQDLTGAGSVNTPGLIVDDHVANEEFWWERTISARFIGAGQYDTGGDTVDSPWWTFMDRSFGKGKFIAGGDVPTISVYNAASIAVTFLHKVRMLTNRAG